MTSFGPKGRSRLGQQLKRPRRAGPPQPPLGTAPVFEGPFSSATSIFRESVQAMAAVSTAEREANQYAAKVGNQFNYGSSAWDYEGKGKTANFFGYEGIGYGGAVTTSRAQILWENFDIPVFEVPGSLANQKTWFAINEEEILREWHENNNLQAENLAVPIPDPKLLVAGIVKFEGTLASTTEMTEISGWPANRSLKVNGNASLVKGPGLPVAGVYLGICGATTATLVTPATETHAKASYEAFSLEGAGTDRHCAIWRPSTDEYWEFWNLGMWGPLGIQKFRCLGVASGSLSILKRVGAKPSVDATLPEIKCKDGSKVIIEAGTVLSNWNEATGEVTLTPPANFPLEFGTGATQVETSPKAVLTLSSGQLGEEAGKWRYGNANYFKEVSKSNGIGTLPSTKSWGARATNLSAIAGNISQKDLVTLLSGGEISHAIGVNLIVTKEPALAPAGRGDASELKETGGNTGASWQVVVPTFSATVTSGSAVVEGTSPNTAVGMVLKAVAGKIAANTKVTKVNSASQFEISPVAEATGSVTVAYALPNLGTVDAVPQGSWYRFPNVKAEELTAYGVAHGLTGVVNIVKATNPLAWGIYEAIRQYGLVPLDRTSASVKGMIADPKTILSPYNPGAANGLAGYTSGGNEPTRTALEEYAGAAVVGAAPASGMTPLKGELQGTNCAFNKLPWPLLEQVVARAK